MVETRQVGVRNGDVLVLVGTMKGAFLFRSDRARQRWTRGIRDTGGLETPVADGAVIAIIAAVSGGASRRR
jgi:molybdopterin converting factor small subunit